MKGANGGVGVGVGAGAQKRTGRPFWMRVRAVARATHIARYALA
jgi:hypothetical protein